MEFSKIFIYLHFWRRHRVQKVAISRQIFLEKCKNPRIWPDYTTLKFQAEAGGTGPAKKSRPTPHFWQRSLTLDSTNYERGQPILTRPNRVRTTRRQRQKHDKTITWRGTMIIHTHQSFSPLWIRNNESSTKAKATNGRKTVRNHPNSRSTDSRDSRTKQ